jgi:hypothetical protein
MELLGTPPTVTVMFRSPAVRLLGTGTTSFASLREEGGATVEPKVTKLAPWVAPKLDPVMVMGVLPGPNGCERLLIEGAD